MFVSSYLVTEHLDQNDFLHNFIIIEKSKYSRSPIQMDYMIFHHQMEKEILQMNHQHSKGIAHENASENYPEAVRTLSHSFFSIKGIPFNKVE